MLLISSKRLGRKNVIVAKIISSKTIFHKNHQFFLPQILRWEFVSILKKYSRITFLVKISKNFLFSNTRLLGHMFMMLWGQEDRRQRGLEERRQRDLEDRRCRVQEVRYLRSLGSFRWLSDSNQADLCFPSNGPRDHTIGFLVPRWWHSVDSHMAHLASLVWPCATQMAHWCQQNCPLTLHKWLSQGSRNFTSGALEGALWGHTVDLTGSSMWWSGGTQMTLWG